VKLMDLVLGLPDQRVKKVLFDSFDILFFNFFHFCADEINFPIFGKQIIIIMFMVAKSCYGRCGALFNLSIRSISIAHTRVFVYKIHLNWLKFMLGFLEHQFDRNRKVAGMVK
jgi:hypothetical protein